MGKKKNNSHCLHAMMFSFLVLVSLVIIISLYKDYKYRQVYGNVDMAKRQRNFHRSAYKTQIPQSSVREVKKAVTTAPVQQPRAKFYSESSILDHVLVNLTKYGGPVQGQVRRAGLQRRRASDDEQAHSEGEIVSNHDSKVVSFLGIPYAQPPVGSKLFESAKMSTSWKAPLDASRQPFKCPQVSQRPLFLSQTFLCFLFFSTFCSVFNPVTVKHQFVEHYLYQNCFETATSIFLFLYLSSFFFLHEPSFISPVLFCFVVPKRKSSPESPFYLFELS